MNARSAWLSPNGQTREDTRVAQLGTVTPAGPVESRSGIVPGSTAGNEPVTGFKLNGTNGGMTATIGIGRAVVQTTATRGAYPVAVTEPITLTFADGHQQYPRKDLVVRRLSDDQYDASGRTAAVVEIVKGEAVSATPPAPATPAAALPLYYVTVPIGAGAGGNGLAWATGIEDLRSTVVATGGILPALGSTGNGAYPGQYRDTNSALQRWNGTAWVPYPRDIGGIAPNGALTNGSYAGQYRDGPSGQLQRWNGSAWTPAVPGPAFANSLLGGFTSSTTYAAALAETPTGPSVAPLTLNFTAPPSGAVLITMGSRMEAPSAGATKVNAFMAPQVTQGSTVTLAAADQNAAQFSVNPGATVTYTVRLGSLTAGTTYTLTAMYRSTVASQSCWFSYPYLRVDPMA